MKIKKFKNKPCCSICGGDMSGSVFEGQGRFVIVPCKHCLPLEVEIPLSSILMPIPLIRQGKQVPMIARIDRGEKLRVDLVSVGGGIYRLGNATEELMDYLYCLRQMRVKNIFARVVDG